MRRLAFAVISLSFGLLSGTWGACQPPDPSPASLPPLRVESIEPGGLDEPEILPRALAEFELALGRIRLARDRYRIVRQHEEFPEGRGERAVQISVQSGRPTLRLTYHDLQEDWSMQIDNTSGVNWTRRFQSQERETTVTYQQPPGQRIRISVSGYPGVIEGESLWHLCQQDPPGFRAAVYPALRRLNPRWELPQSLTVATGLRRTLRSDGATIDMKNLVELLDCLESSDRGERTAAFERLDAAGLSIQFPLQQLARGPLAPQQRQMVLGLLDRLEPRSEDTPTRVAYWLSGDPNWR